MRGIDFNGRHSIKDMDLYVADLDISPPKKRHMTQTIPFMNGAYDFSNIYGVNTYEERTLTYSFEIIAPTQAHLNLIKIKVLAWLLNGEKGELRDDGIPGYYFIAKCISVTEDDNRDKTTIKATFSAYPFKICDSYEGENLWDPFCFETDVLQRTRFTVDKAQKVSIYNVGVVDVIPVIYASETFEIIMNENKYTVSPGVTQNDKFRFKVGNNELLLKGTGEIQFFFRKEVL